MDSIKISVDVNVHLSEKTEGFILDLVKSIMPGVVKAQAHTKDKEGKEVT